MAPHPTISFLQWALLVTLASWAITQCHAGHHFCVNGHTLITRLDEFYRQDATLIPEQPDEPLDKRNTYKRCSWEIWVDSGKPALQVALMGLRDVSDVASDLHSQHNVSLIRDLTVTLASRSTIKVFSGMLHVLTLEQSQHISVEINWDPRTQVRSPVNLRILIPYPRYCSRDMLSFHGNCHAVSPLPSNVTVSMSNIRGDAQLASFISMSQVKSFIAANEARRGVHPYRRALELSQAVRLGMFYSAIPHATILSVVRNESGCVLQELLERPEEMLATAAPMTGACGSLRVDESGRAVMEFGDCSKPMLSLMSFPETASSPAAAATGFQDCWERLRSMVEELQEQWTSHHHVKVNIRTDEAGPSPWIAGVVLLALLAALVLAGFIVTQVVLRRRRRPATLRLASESKEAGPLNNSTHPMVASVGDLKRAAPCRDKREFLHGRDGAPSCRCSLDRCGLRVPEFARFCASGGGCA